MPTYFIFLVVWTIITTILSVGIAWDHNNGWWGFLHELFVEGWEEGFSLQAVASGFMIGLLLPGLVVYTIWSGFAYFCNQP